MTSFYTLKLVGLTLFFLLLTACTEPLLLSPSPGGGEVWLGQLSSSLYADSATLELRVASGTPAVARAATLRGEGTALGLECRATGSEMECYRFSSAETFYMVGPLRGRGWSGSYSFSGPNGSDRGTFSFVQQY